MPEHPGFDLRQIDDRSIVRLRVRPRVVDAACKALRLPADALQWSGEDPRACWLGPEQWLLSSDAQSAQEIIGRIDAALAGQLYAATDMSSQNACFSLSGPAARMLLAMGCGIDMHRSALEPGQCVRTNFANVPLFIVVVEGSNFDLYVDRSYARYLRAWFLRSGEDPVTRDSKHCKQP